MAWEKRAPISCMLGTVYGNLTVVAYAGAKNNRRLWRCRCGCGNTKIAEGIELRRGNVKSCGCMSLIWSGQAQITHGQSGTQIYRMYHRAKERAMKKGIEFNLRLTDIKIPPCCPVFKTPFTHGNRDRATSPSLDRLDSSKGYTPDNIWVISFRANTIKNDASLADLKSLVAAWELMGGDSWLTQSITT